VGFVAHGHEPAERIRQRHRERWFFERECEWLREFHGIWCE